MEHPSPDGGKAARKAIAWPTHPDWDQERTLEAIEYVVGLLAPGFVFGYFDKEDIKQDGRIHCLEALARYDNKRCLKAFLYDNLKRRYLNDVRNKLWRSDPPCKQCHKAVMEGASYCGRNGERLCDQYADYVRRNTTKRNLMNPTHMGDATEERPGRQDRDVAAESEERELLAKIDRELPVELRSDYLRMRENLRVPQARQQEVLAAIRLIVGGGEASEGG
jgi:DNA-directed RNA polymerase specialized sigma24 family protein